MKKTIRVVNIVATAISILSILAVVVLVAIFSSPQDINVEESILTIEQIQITRRNANNNISFYAENAWKNLQYYLVVAFELYDIENQSIYLTINDTSTVFLISINDNQEASVVYN